MPHAPVQSFMFAQSSEQLSPHVIVEISQAEPAPQLHVAPLHVGGVPLLLLPHANAMIETRKLMMMIRMAPS